MDVMDLSKIEFLSTIRGKCRFEASETARGAVAGTEQILRPTARLKQLCVLEFRCFAVDFPDFGVSTLDTPEADVDGKNLRKKLYHCQRKANAQRKTHLDD